MENLEHISYINEVNKMKWKNIFAFNDLLHRSITISFLNKLSYMKIIAFWFQFLPYG